MEKLKCFNVGFVSLFEHQSFAGPNTREVKAPSRIALLALLLALLLAGLEDAIIEAFGCQEFGGYEFGGYEFLDVIVAFGGLVDDVIVAFRGSQLTLRQREDAE